MPKRASNAATTSNNGDTSARMDVDNGSEEELGGGGAAENVGNNGGEVPAGGWKKGDRVLCSHGVGRYEASIIEVDDGPVYTIHYQGWNKRYDEKLTEAEARARMIMWSEEKAAESKVGGGFKNGIFEFRKDFFNLWTFCKDSFKKSVNLKKISKFQKRPLNTQTHPILGRIEDRQGKGREAEEVPGCQAGRLQSWQHPVSGLGCQASPTQPDGTAGGSCPAEGRRGRQGAQEGGAAGVAEEDPRRRQRVHQHQPVLGRWFWFER